MTTAGDDTTRRGDGDGARGEPVIRPVHRIPTDDDGWTDAAVEAGVVQARDDDEWSNAAVAPTVRTPDASARPPGSAAADSPPAEPTPADSPPADRPAVELSPDERGEASSVDEPAAVDQSPDEPGGDDPATLDDARARDDSATLDDARARDDDTVGDAVPAIAHDEHDEHDEHDADPDPDADDEHDADPDAAPPRAARGKPGRNTGRVPRAIEEPEQSVPVAIDDDDGWSRGTAMPAELLGETAEGDDGGGSDEDIFDQEDAADAIDAHVYAPAPVSGRDAASAPPALAVNEAPGARPMSSAATVNDESTVPDLPRLAPPASETAGDAAARGGAIAATAPATTARHAADEPAWPEFGTRAPASTEPAWPEFGTRAPAASPRPEPAVAPRPTVAPSRATASAVTPAAAPGAATASTAGTGEPRTTAAATSQAATDTSRRSDRSRDDDDADDPPRRASPRRPPSRWRRRIVWLLVVMVLMSGGIAGLTVLGDRNSDNYYLVCGERAIAAEQGRGFPPWGSSRLSGLAWKPIERPPGAECDPITTSYPTELTTTYRTKLMDVATGRIDRVKNGIADDVSKAQAELEQALLLAGTSAPDHIEARAEIQRLLADVEFLRARDEIRGLAARLEAVVSQFEAAYAGPQRRTSDADAWARFAADLAAEIKQGPPGTRPQPKPSAGGPDGTAREAGAASAGEPAASDAVRDTDAPPGVLLPPAASPDAGPDTPDGGVPEAPTPQPSAAPTPARGVMM